MEGLTQKENQKRAWCPGSQVRKAFQEAGNDQLCEMSKRGAETWQLELAS